MSTFWSIGELRHVRSSSWLNKPPRLLLRPRSRKDPYFLSTQILHKQSFNLKKKNLVALAKVFKLCTGAKLKEMISNIKSCGDVVVWLWGKESTGLFCCFTCFVFVVVLITSSASTSSVMTTYNAVFAVLEHCLFVFIRYEPITSSLHHERRKPEKQMLDLLKERSGLLCWSAGEPDVLEQIIWCELSLSCHH